VGVGGGFEDGAGVATATKGRVEVASAGGGGEEGEDFAKEDGLVALRLRHVGKF